MKGHNLMLLFRRLAMVGVALCFVVVLLGAFVRLSAAGLGCPDWPGCYGHISAGAALKNEAAVNAAFPDRPLEHAKAWKEMVHRYAALVLGLVIAALAVLALINRRNPQQPVAVPVLLVFLVALQAYLGMLTVTLLLKPLIVTLHLLGGMSILALLWWLMLTPQPDLRQREHSSLKGITVFALVLVAAQIALGGWTSTNYAAVACPDFPMCQAQWWPQMDFRDAFVLWRGLGIDYEGGVLDHPARVAIHLTHRIGAVVLTAVVAALGIIAIRRARNSRVKAAGMGVLAALALQLLIGISMVVDGFPLWLATAHNGGAALLLVALITLYRRVCAPTGN